LIIGLIACKGTETANAAVLPAAAAPSTAVGADVPPPPSLQALAAAPPVPADSGAAATAQALDATRAQLDAALAKASRCSADTQCRSVATGGKACGGATGYRAYSTQGADAAAIEALAAKERELSLTQARASGRVSACFMLADPGARCVHDKCVTGGAEPPDSGAATR